MNTDQLMYFLKLAHTQHLTHAAEILNISQPALSNSIARLEEELGVKLFDRRGRNIYLNSFGESFFPYAQNALAFIEKGKQSLSELQGHSPKCTIQIGNIAMFPALLDNILSVASNISIINAAVPSYELENNLLSGQTDLCITCRELTHPKLEQVELYSTDIYFVSSHQNNFSKHKFVTPDELRNEVFVNTGNYSGLKECFNIIYGSSKFQPALGRSAMNYNEAIECISKGLYVSFLSSNAIRVLPEQLKQTLSMLPVKLNDGSTPKIGQYLYWKQGSQTSTVTTVRSSFINYFSSHII